MRERGRDEMGLRKKMVVWVMMLLIGARWCECRDPVLHRVGGGRYSWSPDFNFSNWSSGETFYSGDWLYFGFDKHIYSVLEVNQTSYESCIEKDFIKNITQGGRDVFELKEPKPYYFISGGGYCFHGMKLRVLVHDAPPPAQPPVRFTSSGPGRTGLLPAVGGLVLGFVFGY